MIYFLLTLFFGSLIGIIFMIGKKLMMLQNGQIVPREEIAFQAPDLEKLKYSTIKNIKKYGYFLLVLVIRLYFRSLNFVKNKYQEAKARIKNMRSKKLSEEEKREVNNFLKMISDYKRKIRAIKQKIKEEEEM